MTIRKQVERFWKTFLVEQKNLEKALKNKNDEEVKEISNILNMYFEELCNCALEVSFNGTFYELTFLSASDKNVQLICVLLKAMTPEQLKENWIINAWMPPLSDKALSTVLRIKEKDYTPDSFIVYYEIDEVNKCINTKVYCDAFQFLESSKAYEIAVYMIQLFVGECAMEAYINTIEVVEAPEVEDNCLLEEFYEVILEIVSEQKWVEYSDPTTIYRVYQLQETITSEEVRKDMKMIFTTHPILMSEVLENSYVTYHEFFDFGGEFGYLYYEQKLKEGHDAMFRQQLEKKLQNLFYQHGIARNIGGAVGEKYAYIDFAIYDKEVFLKALQSINEKLSIELTYRSFEEDEVLS